MSWNKVLELSFTLKNRFNLDSVKSPNGPNAATIKPIIIQFPCKFSPKYSEFKNPAIMVKIIPPKKPSHVFAPEILSANLCFPIKFPVKYANVSLHQSNRKRKNFVMHHFFA